MTIPLAMAVRKGVELFERPLDRGAVDDSLEFRLGPPHVATD
jgi:hypothetical protein